MAGAEGAGFRLAPGDPVELGGCVVEGVIAVGAGPGGANTVYRAVAPDGSAVSLTVLRGAGYAGCAAQVEAARR
ncbi:hypothetical protein [Actinocorallia herbida]|uniref:hypothetical protein n=1 Tax=Actinocorallia herbida TaxID=58109 RepID=UPI001476B9E1|nr:hypothetical protein [Actinocorallia herbida]